MKETTFRQRWFPRDSDPYEVTNNMGLRWARTVAVGFVSVWHILIHFQ